MRTAVLGLCAALVAASCGGHPPPPKRRVIEGNVESWVFRRYQRVADIEVWVPKNQAIAHTASYVKKDALKRGRLGEQDVVNAFVTEYKTDAGVLRAVVKFSRRLAQESGYVVEDKKRGGVRVILVEGHGEAWALWSSKKYIVKIGGRGLKTVPSSMVESYGDRYPSSLSSGILDGPLPPGPDEEPEVQPDDYDPNSPRPDYKHDEKKKQKKK